MAYPGKLIRNPKTGQSYLFLQTNQSSAGSILEMQSEYEAGSTEPPMHYHPYQIEDFTILDGELTVYIDGSIRILTRGEQLHIPANTIHAMWNATNTKTVVNWKVVPALHSEYLFENFTGLAMDNKTDKNGKPTFLQSIMLAHHFAKVFRLAKPAYPVMKILFSILVPVAKLAGYKGTYGRYID